jgi:peptide/nickel transport system permease protein
MFPSMSSMAAPPQPDTPGSTPSIAERSREPHPILGMVIRRSLFGILTIVVIATIVYAATLVLPGDAATAILGQTATPARIHLLRRQLGLDAPVLTRFWHWAAHAVRGDFGNSLSLGAPVTSLVGVRLANSAILVAAVAVISTTLGVVAGTVAALRRDGWFDTIGSALAMVSSALPEFVVAIFIVMLFAVNVFQLFPAISLLPPGASILTAVDKLALPVVTLVIVVTPYMFRMSRGAMIEALDSDYVEFAKMKGVPLRRILFRHALPNALPPVIQVAGLNLLYLAGGIVLVETVFDYPGIGQMLVQAIDNRDVPMIQFIVLVLAVFCVGLNIVTDVGALLATPRRRYPRS